MKIRMFSISAFIIVIGIIVFFSVGNGNSMHSVASERTGTSENADASLQKSRKGHKKSQEGRRRNNLAKYIKSLKKEKESLPLEPGDDDGDREQISQEEHERRVERKHKIEHLLWPESPSYLEGIWSEQLPDNAWTNRISTYLESQIELDEFGGTRLVSVDCRDNLCKTILEHDDNKSFESFRDGPASNGPMETDAVGHPEFLENGSVVTTIYFAREGGDDTPFEEMQERMLADLESKE